MLPAPPHGQSLTPVPGVPTLQEPRPPRRADPTARTAYRLMALVRLLAVPFVVLTGNIAPSAVSVQPTLLPVPGQRELQSEQPPPS